MKPRTKDGHRGGTNARAARARRVMSHAILTRRRTSSFIVALTRRRALHDDEKQCTGGRVKKKNTSPSY